MPGVFFNNRAITVSGRPRRLDTDEDVERLLHEAFPLLDDPQARVALAAEFSRRHELHARLRRARLLGGALVLGTAMFLVILEARRLGHK